MEISQSQSSNNSDDTDDSYLQVVAETMKSKKQKKIEKKKRNDVNGKKPKNSKKKQIPEVFDTVVVQENEITESNPNTERIDLEMVEKLADLQIEHPEVQIVDDFDDVESIDSTGSIGKKRNRRRGKKGKSRDASENPDRPGPENMTHKVSKINNEIHTKIVHEIIPKIDEIKHTTLRFRKETGLQRPQSKSSKLQQQKRVVSNQENYSWRNPVPGTSRNANPQAVSREIQNAQTPLLKMLDDMRRRNDDNKRVQEFRGKTDHAQKPITRYDFGQKNSNDRKQNDNRNGNGSRNDQKLSPADKILLQLVTASAEDREKLIMSWCEERKLIFYTNESKNKFRVNPTYASQAQKLQMERKMDEMINLNLLNKKGSQADFDDPEFLSKLEQVNTKHYTECFQELFKDCVEESERTKSIEELTNLLIEKNKARIFEGEIRINSKNMREAYVSNASGGKDVCITGIILRKYALNGDIVKILVKNDIVDENEDEADVESEEGALDETINSESELENTLEKVDESKLKAKAKIEISKCHGCVLEIVKKIHTRQTIGTFNNVKAKKKLFLNFTPRDTRIPLISVLKSSADELKVNILQDVLYLVEIIGNWGEQPYGKIVKEIGKKNDLEVENLAILLQNNLNPQPYSNEILEKLPKEPFEIPAKEFEYRMDLRKKCIFSIDPETARDLDDAVSCEVLPNGNLEIGVHISDVTYFMKENSELDDIVKEKATTIYLVNTVYHMLPVPLCLLCSLLPGSDKLAYSVFWEMKEDTAEILSTKFYRSIINNCAQLSYNHAQAIIENPGKDWNADTDSIVEFPSIHNGFTVNDVAFVIEKLQGIALLLRRKRIENGALRIDQPKLSFQLHENTGFPISFWKYEIKDSNRLIEEFMLLANISVAKFIHDKFPDSSILRQHSAPREGTVKKLIKNLSKHGFDINTGSSKDISESIVSIVHQAEFPDAANAVVNVLASKVMQRAKYFCSFDISDEGAFWHYALSIPIYTHFTSPIRRYADILVHRVLSAALEYEAPPNNPPQELQRLANVSNIQKYNAKLAGEDSSNLYFRMFVEQVKELHMRAGVVGVFSYNLEVVLIETGHVLKVYYKNLESTKRIAVKVIETDENSPPNVSFIFLRGPTKTVKQIKMNTELACVLSIHKDKLVINEVMCG